MATEDLRAAGADLGHLNMPLFAITGGFILLFCGLALWDLELLGTIVNTSFAFSAKYFGLYWQLLLLATFLIGLALCFFPGASERLGEMDEPEFTTFQWGAMIMCTLLAGGGVFWAAGEPIAHFLSTPPLFGDLAQNPEAAAQAALAQSYLHWGFLAWAILGALTTIMLMHYHYERGLPLAPRTLLYPVFKERALSGPIGLFADAACIIAVVAGTVGPIGFLGLQVSYGLNALFAVPDTFTTQLVIIVALATLYTVSAMTGISRGIQLLSKINVIMAFVLVAFMLEAGPTAFIFAGFFGGMTTYLMSFFDLAMYRGDAGLFGEPGWLSWWTVFFWGWFLGYGPLMAIFIARQPRPVDHRHARDRGAAGDQFLVHDHRRQRHRLRARHSGRDLGPLRGLQPAGGAPRGDAGDADGLPPVAALPRADDDLRGDNRRFDELRHLHGDLQRGPADHHGPGVLGGVDGGDGARADLDRRLAELHRGDGGPRVARAPALALGCRADHLAQGPRGLRRRWS